MKKENFIFTIGYKGSYAIIDKTSRRKYSSLDSIGLLEKGFLKFSFCSALYDYEINKKDIKEYLETLKNKTSINKSYEEFKSLFGVFMVPNNIKDFIFI